MPFSYSQQQYIDISEVGSRVRITIVLESGETVTLYKDARDKDHTDFLRVDVHHTSREILFLLFASIQNSVLINIHINSSWLTRKWKIKRYLPTLQSIEGNSMLGVCVWYDMPVVGEQLTIQAGLANDYDPGNWWHSGSTIRSVEFTTLPGR
jgi:hypothetical protein